MVEIIKECIEKTNYIEHLKLDPLTIEDRLENLDQLINKGMDWQDMSGTNDLAKFLEDISLNSSLDDSLSHDEAISLMTIHNSKGLEFDLSFLVGLEEDLFPHINSRNDEASVEEERRLCYVAVTRAKKHLYLTHCSSRFLWGMKKSQYPSRFLKEIPASLLEKINSTQMEKIASMSRVEKTTPPIPLQAKFAPIEFKQQELVFHQEFGIGQIKEIKNGSLGLVFIVHFIKSNQTKTLVGKYANLTKLK